MNDEPKEAPEAVPPEDRATALREAMQRRADAWLAYRAFGGEATTLAWLRACMHLDRLRHGAPFDEPRDDFDPEC